MSTRETANGNGQEGLNPNGAQTETIRRGEELYRLLARELPNVAVVVFTPDLEVLIAEGEALMAHGVQDLEAEGQPLRDVMLPETYASLEAVYRGALKGERSEIEQTAPDGRSYFRVVGKPLVEDDGTVWAGLVMAQDVTSLRTSEQELRVHSERLAELAERDGLTELPNRALFQDRLEQALVRSKRDKHQLALLFVDLDRFKNVNDSLGHEAGDHVLKVAAQRMAAAVRAGDTVARLGGDELVILIEPVGRGSDTAATIHRIQEALRKPIEVAGSEIVLTASIGVAMTPRDGTTPTELLAAADRAMYRAKAGGGDRHRFFDPTMHEEALERLHTEADMRHAIDRDEFVLRYQPAIDLRSERVVSVEALIRWNHPKRGFLPPDAFIPIAEQTGLAADITAWVLDRACRQACEWERAGVPPVRVAINSCSRELGGSLGGLIEDTLQRTGLAPDHLEIEVTERYLGEDDEVRDEMLAAIKRLGVTIALDDFGTGYSSLARLRSFPVDVIKIDRTFVAELGQTSAIVDTIITLAKNLGVQVIAEGVEREEQCDWLKEADCAAASGFFFCRPLPAEELTPWLLEHA